MLFERPLSGEPNVPCGWAASVHSPNSSLESGHWNSATRKRPVGSVYSRPNEGRLALSKTDIPSPDGTQSRDEMSQRSPCSEVSLALSNCA
jgi:hypothetical protein